MNITLLIASLVLVEALVVFTAAMMNRRKVVDGAAAAAWLGLAATMIAIYLGELPGIAGALSVASLAGIVVLPVTVRERWVWTSGVCYGALIPVAMGLGAVSLAATASVGAVERQHANLLLIAGQWGAISAALSAAMAAVGTSAWRLRSISGHLYVAVAGRGVMMVIAAALGALGLAGWLRSDVPTTLWSMPLHNTAGGRAMWGLPAELGGPQTFGFRVAMPVDEGVPLLVAVGLVALGASLLHHELRPKLARVRTSAAWLLTFALTLVTLGVVVYHGLSPELPDPTPYLTWGADAARLRELPDTVIKMATFSAKADGVFVRWASLAPEAFLVTMLMGLTGTTAWLTRRRHMSPLASFSEGSLPAPGFSPDVEDEEDAPVHRLWPNHGVLVGSMYARDLLVRASALLWIGWTLGALVTWRLHGAYGYGSPTEWLALGLAVAVTGLTVMMWGGSAEAQREMRRTIPAIVAGALLLGITCAFASGVTFGVPFRF